MIRVVSLLSGRTFPSAVDRKTSNEQHLTKTGIIAIVDDDEPLREALGSVMKAAGFSTDTFASAEEFLDSASGRDTACLILDVRFQG